MRRSLLFLMIFVFAFSLLSGCKSTDETDQSQTIPVSLSEVMSSGDTTDWIELHNDGDTEVSLAGCFLSNDVNKPGKWEFGDITLQPDAYLVLLADGTSTSLHLGTLHLPFKLSASGETLLFSDHNGNILQKWEIPSGASGLSYGRDETANDKNGTLVWFASPTPGASNKTGMILGKEACVKEYGLRITEYCTDNKTLLYDSDGDYPDWIEIYNFSDHEIDLSDYSLTDSRKTADKWSFPSGVHLLSGECLLVYCSGKNKITAFGELHTGFKLGNDDSFLGLYRPDGALCCGVNYQTTTEDHSFVYTEADGYVLTSHPTPKRVDEGGAVR